MFSACVALECATDDVWLAERRKGVGASESPVLFGPEVSSWGSGYSLWAEKSGLIAPAPVVGEAIKWGNRLEDAIADAYAEETGRRIVNLGKRTLLRSKHTPHMQATLDRVIEDAERGPGPLDIKNVGSHKLDEWVERPPLRYQVQLQQQMAVTGARWGALGALVGGQKLIRFDIDRDDEFIASLEEVLAEFWGRVETKTPPPIDESEATRQALARLWAKDNGQTVELEQRFAEIDATLQALKAEQDAIEAKERALKNELIAAIGPATFAKLPGGVSYSFKTIEKKAHEVKASSYRQLRRIATK